MGHLKMAGLGEGVSRSQKAASGQVTPEGKKVTWLKVQYGFAALLFLPKLLLAAA